MRILLDAVYVNNSGGLVLLQYLVQEMEKQTLDVHYFLDDRISHLNIAPAERTTYSVGSENNRKKFYKEHGDKFSSVFCFSNIPPTRRLKAKVFTFFQNVILLDLPKQVKIAQRPKWLLKRFYILHMKGNTDGWIVQTSNSKSLLCKKMGVADSDVLVCPFYDESKFPPSQEPNAGTDYSYVAKCIPEKNHALLLQGWIELAKHDCYPTLHLTIENYPIEIADLLEKADSFGCKIVNHGQSSLEEVREIYRQSKAVVYTSMNESFGLGIIEAMSQGCDVIGPMLPYVTCICEPSESFNYDYKSLADAIIRFEKGESPKTTNLVSNMIEELISEIAK